MQVTNSQTLSYFWRHAKQYKLALFIQCLGTVITMVAGFIMIPLVLKEFIDLMTTFDGPDKSVLWQELTGIFWVVVVLEIVAFWIGARMTDLGVTQFQIKSMRDIENDSFEVLQRHSHSFFTNHFVGALVSKVFRLVHSFERIGDIFAFNLWPNLIRFGAAIGVLFFIIPKVAWILVGWTFLFGVIVYAFTKWKMKYDLANARANTAVTASLADSITNISNIKTFARKLFERKRFFGKTDEQFEARQKSWGLGNLSNFIQAVLMTSLELVMLYILMQGWMNGTISIGTIILTQAYLAQFYINLWGFGNIIKNVHESFANSEEMIQIIQETPEIQDVANPEKCQISEGAIDFKNVDFSYGGETQVFKKFNLDIKPGEKIGLVGESGSGKSTLTKLLLRFVDIDSGEILIDGQNIAKIRQDDLRSSIAYVPQEPILFHRTLLENIRYGDLKSTDKEVWTAAKRANAHTFIQNTPEKYETMVGERGVKLSGGEKQRIAIARAMLKNAPILLLDEATSSLDSNSEKLIQEALERLMKDCTTIIIAHRLSTIQQMDRIIVFDQGKIVEMGSHDELLKKKGKYAELWSHQAGGFLAG